MGVQLLGNQKFGELNEQQQELEEHQRRRAAFIRYYRGTAQFSQVESGNIRLTVEKCSPKDIVQAAVKNVEKLAEQKNISISTEFLQEDSDLVMADFDKTVWVMNNFLTNAVKHSFQDEGIRILVENTTLYSVQHHRYRKRY
jgi:K+-sensing histidine kinase KdpD